MRAVRNSLTARVTLLACLTALPGCVFATDLINPGVLSALGFDPATVIPPQGRLLVAFTNSTTSPALFFAQASDDPADPLANLRTLDTEIGSPLTAGETRTIVLDCPVGVLTPGQATADFSTGGTVALVLDAAGTAIAYNGAPLILDREFQCGDLIEFQLIQLGDGGAYTLAIRVLPGR